MRKAEIAASLLTALLAAASPAGNLFAQQGGATEAPDGAGRTLTDAEMLLAGAEANRIDVILHLLGRGVDPNARANGGFTALIAAAGRGSAEALELLLARGADADLANDEGWTPLMEAAAREEEEALKLLLRTGADVNVREARRARRPS